MVTTNWTTAEQFAAMSEGAIDMNMEVWIASKSEEASFYSDMLLELDQQVVQAGELGYEGRSGVYVYTAAG